LTLDVAHNSAPISNDVAAVPKPQIVGHRRKLLDAIGSSGLICFRTSGVVRVLEERLFDFSLNSEEPFFRASRTVTKMVCLCFKFARSFLGLLCPCLGVVHSFFDCAHL
jgi:hypothetical protein